MSTLQIAILIWLGGLLGSMRPVGKWWLGRQDVLSSDMHCHAELSPGQYNIYARRYDPHRRNERPGECERRHVRDCWRGHLSPTTRDRSFKDGFFIVGIAAAWPVMVLPSLALSITPLTEPELAARKIRLQAEIAQLEKEKREGDL